MIVLFFCAITTQKSQEIFVQINKLHSNMLLFKKRYKDTNVVVYICVNYTRRVGLGIL